MKTQKYKNLYKNTIMLATLYTSISNSFSSLNTINQQKILISTNKQSHKKQKSRIKREQTL